MAAAKREGKVTLMKVLRPLNPAPAGGRLPQFQAIMVCERSRFEELLGPAAKRR
jgi:hypothetical protein